MNRQGRVSGLWGGCLRAFLGDDVFLGYHLQAALLSMAASEDVTHKSDRKQQQPRQPGHLRYALRLPDHLRALEEGETLKFFPEWMSTKSCGNSTFLFPGKYDLRNTSHSYFRRKIKLNGKTSAFSCDVNAKHLIHSKETKPIFFSFHSKVPAFANEL